MGYINRLMLLFLGVLLWTPSFAMEHYTNTVKDQYSKVIGGASVTVYLTGTTTLATIYSDNLGTSKANPFTTNVISGVVDFYAKNGVYDLVFSAPGKIFNANTTKGIPLFDYRDVAATTAPTSPFVGQPVMITNDSSSGACSFGGGTAISWCAWSGSDWISVGGSGGSGGASGWPTTDAGDVTFANTLANGVCIGAGTNPICIYEDGTLGSLIRPQADANTRTYIWTDKQWSMFDVEGNKDMMISDPDAFATGSGTVTMQTSEQFVVSNLGLEFNESDTNPTCSSGNYTTFADASEATLVDCINGSRVPRTGELTIRKTSDESVSSATTGTTLQNDDVLLFPVAANSTYTFKAFLRYSGATTGDLKFNFTLPASAVGEKSSVHAPIGATSCSNTSTTIVTNDITQTDANVGAVGTGAGNLCSIIIEGVVVTAGTAGNVTLQWAQVASDATNTTVHANSYITYRRVP